MLHRRLRAGHRGRRARAGLGGEPAGGAVPVSASRRRDPGLSPAELDTVAGRTGPGGLCLLGLRFSGDRTAPHERFATLRERLGDAFEVIELDSGPGNAGGFSRTAHAVLTLEMREEPGHPALAARERVVRFLGDRLVPAAE